MEISAIWYLRGRNRGSLDKYTLRVLLETFFISHITLYKFPSTLYSRPLNYTELFFISLFLNFLWSSSLEYTSLLSTLYSTQLHSTSLFSKLYSTPLHSTSQFSTSLYFLIPHYCTLTHCIPLQCTQLPFDLLLCNPQSALYTVHYRTLFEA